MVKFLFSILRGLNDGWPTQMEVRYCLKLVGDRTDVGLSDRIMRMMWAYVNGIEVPVIRDLHGVTYERVRQCLLKGCRVAHDIR
jgi:hypothetical protein